MLMSQQFGKIARRPTMCRFKKRYGSYSAAERGAKGCHRATGDLVHAYPCAVCGGYHVGGVEPKEATLSRRKPEFAPTLAEQLDEWADEIQALGCRLSC